GDCGTFPRAHAIGKLRCGSGRGSGVFQCCGHGEFPML
ncbi:MAG: hypothetical protein ACI8PT_004446, partial [Gammaproteobacteria bacterium]